MPELTPAQRELAEAYRVSTTFEDWRGNQRVVNPQTVLAVLGALGVDAADPETAEAALRAHQATAAGRDLPACIVVPQDRRLEIPVPAPDGSPPRAHLDLESGGRLELPVSAGTTDAITIGPGLPLGYHTLQVGSDDERSSAVLIVTPSFLGFPPQLAGDRAWGFAVQLYSVRSRDSWGVGDLGDLRELAAWSGAELGADYLLLNPLSAAEPVAPMEPSPYLPSTRSFVNPLYIRVEDVAEYDHLPPAERAEVEALRDAVHAKLDEADTIDRDTAWAAKSAALGLLHRRPRTSEREAAYQAFLEGEGEVLRDFATWCVLANVHGLDWHEWPSGLRHPKSDAVEAFRDQHADEVDFYAWLQWIVDDQLRAAQRDALAGGMRLGIMHDLAVGVHPIGADSWTRQETLATGVTVGAPPDAFNQLGQDWNQPPWRPDRLAAAAYRPYRDLIARLLRYAGGVRVDHIIGLFRLWWIPEGMTPDQGTYVRYDHEALVGILALEGIRAGAVVVGEDLGNVEKSARDYLRERGIVGTSILWFERDDDGHPLPADRWREYSMASVTTHDLPPTAGYLAGEHVDLRETLGLLTRPVEEERAADAADREAWLDRLRTEGLLGKDADTEACVRALYEYVTRTPALLVCVALTDAVGEHRTQNQPGTIDEYPNWRVPLRDEAGRPLLLDDIQASERLHRLAQAVNSGLRTAGM